jgi:hypothetical protein
VAAGGVAATVLVDVDVGGDGAVVETAGWVVVGAAVVLETAGRAGGRDEVTEDDVWGWCEAPAPCDARVRGDEDVAR